MNILITGASGLIGSELSQFLTKKGHTIFPMKRGYFANEEFYWQPVNEIIRISETTKIDVVINLAGHNLSTNRWTEAEKKLIYSSRVDSTKLLSDAISKMRNKPSLFISASAIGYYGNSGDIVMDENSPNGTGFLANLCKDWENAADVPDIRSVHLRLGIVLTQKGGMLKKLHRPYKFCLGGKLGSGSQYMSWIGLLDLCRIIEFIIENPQLKGPLNAASPNPITNAEFAKALGKQWRRPTFFTLPGFLLKSVFGEMAEELLLSSTRAIPRELINAGFNFQQRDISKIFK